MVAMSMITINTITTIADEDICSALVILVMMNEQIVMEFKDLFHIMV
jgi:hypothetical protein